MNFIKQREIIIKLFITDRYFNLKKKIQNTHRRASGQDKIDEKIICHAEADPEHL